MYDGDVAFFHLIKYNSFMNFREHFLNKCEHRKIFEIKNAAFSPVF